MSSYSTLLFGEKSVGMWSLPLEQIHIKSTISGHISSAVVESSRTNSVETTIAQALSKSPQTVVGASQLS